MINTSSGVAKEIVNKYIRENMTIGLGSGSAVTKIVKEIGKISIKDSLSFIPTSLQIGVVAEELNLRITDETKISEINIVFDGADQIDSDLNMIKGGGGALLKEKIITSASRELVILADSSKYVKSFTSPVPIEVHKFARSIVKDKLKQIGGQPRLRILEKGYPFITESANLIYDTIFEPYESQSKKENEIKNIPGVIEVGLFTRRADAYYKSNTDGSFEIIFGH
ncbi:MAG TPA: ribose 5-phosphate isomerase A [Nitrososphaeraceae archaeon]|jgi:ribose 5-phosphate isomerase A